MHGADLFIHGIGMDGIERALRAFPLRTGTPCPEWMILGSRSNNIGTGGFLGAG